MPTKEELAKGFTIGEWDVLPARGKLYRGSEVVQPEPKQMSVLLALALRDGDVVTRDELVDECWEGRATSDAPINRSITQLRKHLGDRDRPYQYIEALVRSGYCLKKPVVLKEPDNEPVEAVIIETRKPSRLWAAVVGLAMLAVIAWVVVADRGPQEPVLSIAVMPFTNLTGDETNEYIALGFKEELVHTLQNVPELAIKNIQVPYEGLSIPEVADRLSVDSVLIGALRIEGMELKFSYQLIRADDRVSVSSGQISGRRDEQFALQERLAIKVRKDVVGESDQQLLSLSRPENSAAYDRYLRGQHLLERRRQKGNLESAVALFEESIDLDPSYGPPYLALAAIQVLLPDYRGENFEESYATAIRYVQRGIDADPTIEEAAAAVFGFVYHKQKRWTKAEEAFKQAVSANVVEPNAFNWYSLMLGSVGRFDEALQQGLAGLEIFPDSAVLNSRVAIAYTWVGDNENAGLFFERARQLGVSGGTHALAEAIYLFGQGAFSDSQQATVAGVADSGSTTDWIAPTFAAFDDPANRDAALAALDDAALQNDINPQVEATVRILLDDIDGALAVSRVLVNPGLTYETEFLFLHQARPLRERPEFLELMTTLGIAGYWQQAGCEWVNLSVDCS